MGRRRAAVTGSTVPETASAPATVPVSSIAFNPRNPRDDYNDVAELAESIRSVGLLQPLGVVRYEIFLTHYPEHEHEIGAHDWVVINGNRRLAAARQTELAEVPVRALDHLGRDGLLDESVLVENIHRSALSPLREAEAIRLLADRHGSQAKVAQRIGKTKGYISQRLALLGLTPELRHALEGGDLRLEDARDLGRLPAPEQAAEWDRRRAEQTRAEQPPGVYDVNASDPERGSRGGGATAEDRDVYAVNDPDPGRRARGSNPPGGRIALGDPADIAAQLRKRLNQEQLRQLVQLLQEELTSFVSDQV